MGLAHAHGHPPPAKGQMLLGENTPVLHTLEAEISCFCQQHPGTGTHLGGGDTNAPDGEEVACHAKLRVMYES